MCAGDHEIEGAVLVDVFGKYLVNLSAGRREADGALAAGLGHEDVCDGLILGLRASEVDGEGLGPPTALLEPGEQPDEHVAPAFDAVGVQQLRARTGRQDAEDGAALRTVADEQQTAPLVTLHAAAAVGVEHDLVLARAGERAAHSWVEEEQLRFGIGLRAALASDRGGVVLGLTQADLTKIFDDVADPDERGRDVGQGPRVPRGDRRADRAAGGAARRGGRSGRGGRGHRVRGDGGSKRGRRGRARLARAHTAPSADDHRSEPREGHAGPTLRHGGAARREGPRFPLSAAR